MFEIPNLTKHTPSKQTQLLNITHLPPQYMHKMNHLPPLKGTAKLNNETQVVSPSTKPIEQLKEK